MVGFAALGEDLVPDDREGRVQRIFMGGCREERASLVDRSKEGRGYEKGEGEK